MSGKKITRASECYAHKRITYKFCDMVGGGFKVQAFFPLKMVIFADNVGLFFFLT